VELSRGFKSDTGTAAGDKANGSGRKRHQEVFRRFMES
jgi:hypothetical protein